MKKMYGIYGIYAGIYMALVAALFILGEVYFRFWSIDWDSVSLASGQNLPPESKQVVFIVEEAGHPYWDLVLKGALDAAGKKTWIDVQGPNRAGVGEHLRLIEQAVALKVDGIITQALDDDFIPVIHQAVNIGIPVITIDTDAPRSGRIGFVGTDNYAAGYQAGKYLNEHFNGPLHIGIISGNDYGNHMHLRIQGFKDALQDRKDTRIVATFTSRINQVEAVHQAFNMLSEHPEINMMFGVSALDGPGISAALETYFSDRSVFVIAFDDLPETVELLKDNKIQAIIAQRPYQMGYLSIRLMEQALKGRPIPSVHFTESTVVDRYGLDEYLRSKAEKRGAAP